MPNLIDKAYPLIPTLSMINGSRLTRIPSTSSNRNRPENIASPFILSCIPRFDQHLDYIVHHPPLCGRSHNAKIQTKTGPLQLKNSSKMRNFQFRVTLYSEAGNVMFVALAVALKKDKRYSKNEEPSTLF